MAILSIPPQQNIAERKESQAGGNFTDTSRGARKTGRQQSANNASTARIQNLLQELEEQDSATVVKLGDASIAAPFTSKLSTILCSK